MREKDTDPPTDRFEAMMQHASSLLLLPARECHSWIRNRFIIQIVWVYIFLLLLLLLPPPPPGSEMDEEEKVVQSPSHSWRPKARQGCFFPPSFIFSFIFLLLLQFCLIFYLSWNKKKMAGTVSFLFPFASSTISVHPRSTRLSFFKWRERDIAPIFGGYRERRISAKAVQSQPAAAAGNMQRGDSECGQGGKVSFFLRFFSLCLVLPLSRLFLLFLPLPHGIVILDAELTPPPWEMTRGRVVRVPGQ